MTEPFATILQFLFILVGSYSAGWLLTKAFIELHYRIYRRKFLARHRIAIEQAAFWEAHMTHLKLQCAVAYMNDDEEEVDALQQQYAVARKRFLLETRELRREIA
jgi:hypothetical protein